MRNPGEDNSRNLNPVEQIVTRFALVCKTYPREGTWILQAVQRYTYRCPTNVFHWLVDIDQQTVNQIVRRALPNAACEEKVWREIARTFRARTKKPIRPEYL